MTVTLGEAASRTGFTMSSDDLTGSFLATLAASRPGGLEPGTGVGALSAWLSALDVASTLVTVEQKAEQVKVAKEQLGHDPRVTFWVGDGLEFLQQLQGPFDLIFADTWPGKISHPEPALGLVAAGGFYIIDDMELGWKDREALEPPVSNYLLEVWGVTR